MTQTQELQAMLDKGGIVTVPSGEYLIEKTLIIHDNTRRALIRPLNGNELLKGDPLAYRGGHALALGEQATHPRLAAAKASACLCTAFGDQDVAACPNGVRVGRGRVKAHGGSQRKFSRRAARDAHAFGVLL